MSCDHTGMHRIQPNMSVTDMVAAIAEGPGSFMVLMRCMETIAEWSPKGSVAPLNLLLMLDGKGFYGSHIWLLFKDLCERDHVRLMHHIEMELPCQRCGKFDFFGPGFLVRGTRPEGGAELQRYLAERRYGKPGSIWALEDPPLHTTEWERECAAAREAEAEKPKSLLARFGAWARG